MEQLSALKDIHLSTNFRTKVLISSFFAEVEYRLSRKFILATFWYPDIYIGSF